MSENVAMVTGASSGIGRATALALADAGFHVWLAARDAARTDETRRAIAARTGSQPSVALFDMADPRAIRATADRISRATDHLDVLVNCAGHTFLERQQTDDGIEASFAVNVLGPFLLTSLLEPLLCRTTHARIVDLAGVYHRSGRLDLDDLFFDVRGFRIWPVANTTQQARVLLMEERARRLPRSVTVNAVHPGAVLTRAQRELPWPLRLLIHTVMRPGFVGPTRGARPVVRLATAPDVRPITGRFFRRFTPEPTGASRELARGLWARCQELVGLRRATPTLVEQG